MSRGALTRRGLLFAVTAISLYLLAPALIGVFGAFDELDEISPLWFVAMVALQVGSFACVWGILRLAVRTDRWGPVILSQLAANSFGRVVPGGAATVGAVQYAMLVRAGRALRGGGIGHHRIRAGRLRHPAGPAAARPAGDPHRGGGRPESHQGGAGGRDRLRADGGGRRGLRDLGPAAGADRPRGAGADQPAAAPPRAASTGYPSGCSTSATSWSACSAASGGRPCCSRPAAGSSTTSR